MCKYNFQIAPSLLWLVQLPSLIKPLLLKLWNCSTIDFHSYKNPETARRVRCYCLHCIELAISGQLWLLICHVTLPCHLSQCLLYHPCINTWLLLLDECKNGWMGSIITLNLSFFVYTAVLGSSYENESNMWWVLKSTLWLGDNH